MYIWITNKCQQRCEHCCNAKLLGNEHMTEEVWKAAINYCRGDYIALGGGEPLLHPDIEKIILYGISECESVWLATNGLETEKAIMVANLAKAIKEEVFSCELSRDSYHLLPQPEVLKAFGKNIRNVDGYEKNSGNCDFGSDDGCVCEDHQILVDGKIRLCGCDESPIIGDVFNGIDPKYECMDYTCVKDRLTA